VSSYASLYIRGIEVASWRNELEPTFLFLFKAGEIRRGRNDTPPPGLPGKVLEERRECDEEACVLTAKAHQLTDRLDALGVSTSAAENLFVQLRDDEVRILTDLRQSLDSETDRLDSEIGELTGYGYSDWLIDVSNALNGSLSAEDAPRRSPFSLMKSEWEGVDPRFSLRAFLDGARDDDDVTLDVTDLVEGGWIEEGFDPHAIAAEHFQAYLWHGLPAIVITEGSSDVEILTSAISVLRPHLDGYIRFLDFSFNNEGGAAAAVRTLKAFAAAGVANRTVLLLDNDTAAFDAVRALREQALPAHYSLAHYPSLALVEAYPTIGPTGPALMNVNGLAGSIELYLGEDVLRNSEGELAPVQWTGYVSRLSAYQGEVSDKTAIHKRFMTKVKAAEQNGSPLPGQDWTGLEAILKELLGILADQQVSP
jgi:hypothetical protein